MTDPKTGEKSAPRLSMVVAIGSQNRVLGKNNKLLWHIPEDFKRFKELTKGHPVIMGRKTFESIVESLGKPLPGRANIVISRNPDFSPKTQNELGSKKPASEVFIVSSIEEAVAKASSLDSEEIFNIGGAQIYELGLPYTDRIYLTIVETEKEGDAFFADYSEFSKIISEEKKSDGNYNYTFYTLEREYID